MKILAIFIMIFVLGLSLIPCCSPVSQSVSENLANTSRCCENKDCQNGAQKPDTQGDEEEGCNSCSPFFACGSCVGFTFQAVQFNFTNLDTPTESHCFLFEEQFDSEYFSKMWQPPKIS